MAGTAARSIVTVAAPTPAPCFDVSITRDFSPLATRWDALATSSQEFPFQGASWLDAWYRAFPRDDEITPLIVTVRARGGDLAMVLPLVARRQRGLQIAEFADLNMTDYNAPLIGPAAPTDPAGTTRLWRALRDALPGIDFMRLKKMPLEIAGRPNPLLRDAWTSPCVLAGNVVATTDDFDAYRHSLDRHDRKELERSWRVFTRHAGASFRVIDDRDEALRLLEIMESQQRTRIRELGLTYTLDDETIAAFYRSLIADGLPRGHVVMTALACGEETVAALLGVRNAHRYNMIRISNAGAQWSNCSPGRLVIGRTMDHLHAHGIRIFDFGVGTYAYKRRFGVRPLPLVDLTVGLTWRAAPAVARERAIQALRKWPALDQRVRRAMGQTPERD